MTGFRVTFETSDADCEYVDSGFLDRNGNRVPALIGKETPDVGMTLREALALCTPHENSGRWFSETDGRHDYATGEEERRALHPPEVTSAASYARLARLMGVRL